MNNDKNPLLDGESLKAHRKWRRMSIQELSLETGLSTSFIRQLEKGDVEVEADTLSKLAAALRVEPKELIGEE